MAAVSFCNAGPSNGTFGFHCAFFYLKLLAISPSGDAEGVDWSISMADKMSRTLLILVLAAAAIGGGIYYYNHYIEPQNDGPMERAGEKLDNAIDAK
jgi:hypothetical protein